jgi:hypothetical protein
MMIWKTVCERDERAFIACIRNCRCARVRVCACVRACVRSRVLEGYSGGVLGDPSTYGAADGAELRAHVHPLLQLRRAVDGIRAKPFDVEPARYSRVRYGYSRVPKRTLGVRKRTPGCSRALHGTQAYSGVRKRARGHPSRLCSRTARKGPASADGASDESRSFTWKRVRLPNVSRGTLRGTQGVLKGNGMASQTARNPFSLGPFRRYGGKTLGRSRRTLGTPLGHSWGTQAASLGYSPGTLRVLTHGCFRPY